MLPVTSQKVSLAPMIISVVDPNFVTLHEEDRDQTRPVQSEDATSQLSARDGDESMRMTIDNGYFITAPQC